MESRFRFRLYLLTALILLGTFSLLHRLHQFQIKDQHYYIQKKPGFSVVAIREPGVRGEIKDRNGIALAENYRIYELVVNLGEVREEWVRQWKVEKAGDEDEDGKPPEIDVIVERMILPRLKELGVEPRLNRSAIQDSLHHARGLGSLCLSRRVGFRSIFTPGGAPPGSARSLCQFASAAGLSFGNLGRSYPRLCAAVEKRHLHRSGEERVRALLRRQQRSQRS